jgi:hypothetical protein
MLCENQLREFSMAEERALFLRIAANSNPGETADPEEAIEIFLPERGHGQP